MMGGPPPPPGRSPAAGTLTIKIPPAPLEMFSFTSDDEMKSVGVAEYEAVKKSTLGKFKSGQLVTKRKLLQKLIDDQKMGIEPNRYTMIKSGPNKGDRKYAGIKSAVDLANEIFEYYEKTDTRTAIPTAFNTVFPEGVNAVKAPPVTKKPVTVTKPAEVDWMAELQNQLSKRKDIDIDAVADVTASRAAATRERLDREREEAAQALLLVTKLKKLPPSITTEDPTELIDPDEISEPTPDAKVAIADIADIDQTAAGVVVRAMANKKRGQPLSTDEIDNMMRSFRGYLGTYPANFMKFLPQKRAASPQQPDGTGKFPKVFSFVMNTDLSSGPGKHWVAVRVDTRDENTVEYYDSFGEEPSKHFMKQLNKLVNKLDVPVYLKLKINKIKDQNVNTNNCGWFAMSFIIDRNLGRPFRECSGYDASIAGEENIDALKNKFGYV